MIKIFYCFSQSSVKLNMGAPAIKSFLSQADIGPALDRIILGQGQEANLRFGACHSNNLFSQIKDGKFDGIAQIHRPCYLVARLHHSDHSLEQVVHILETSCLGAIPVNGNRLVLKRLYNEVGYNPAVVWMHIWTIGVKDPDNLYSNLVLLMIVCKEGLGTAFTFIITGTYPDGIYISPV